AMRHHPRSTAARHQAAKPPYPPLQGEDATTFASFTHLRYNRRMNKPLKITQIGNSAGLVLPQDLLAHLDVHVGGTLSVVTTPRGIELSAAEPDFDAQMAAAREVMARRKRALRELAK